jgi:hypothetical protein
MKRQLLSLLILLSASGFMRAQTTYTVNSLSDANTGSGTSGSLRYVLTQINTAASSQMATVNFSVSGTITLTSPLPPLNYPTTINGGNTITISGNDAHRPFFVGAGTAPFTAAAPASPSVIIRNLSIVSGLAQGGNGAGGGGGGAGMGGAIFLNNGTLTVENVTFTENVARGGNGAAHSNINFGGGGGGFAGNGTDGTAIGGPSNLFDGGFGGSAGLLNGSAFISGPGYGGNGGGSFNNGVTQQGRGGTAGGFAGGGGGGSMLYTGNPRGGDGGFGGGAGKGNLLGTPGFGGGSAGSDGGTPGGGGAGMGGAVFQRQGTMTLTNCAFNQNVAWGGTGGSNGSAKGAAIFIHDGTYTLSGLTYTGNAFGPNSSNPEGLTFFIFGGTGVIVERPTVTRIAPDLTSTSATLRGTINPNGSAITVARFEVSTNANLSGAQNINTTPNAAAIGSGSSPVNVSASVSIVPNTRYYYRLVAQNALGTSSTDTGSFIFSPKPFPDAGLQLWLRADSAVTQVSGLVSQWGDLSGNNRTAISSGTARPDFVSSYSSMGGRPVMGFGILGNRSFGFPRITNIRTVFVVAENQNITALQFLLGDSTTFDFHGGTSNNALFDNSFASPFILQGRLLYNGNPVVATAARPTDPTIITVQTTGNVRASTLSFDRPPLGTATFNRSWNGLIAEVLIFSDSLNLTQRIAVENYLAMRYGIGRSNSANPSIPTSQGGTFVLGNTGATVTFITPSSTAGSLSGSVTNSRPNVFGSLPTGITNLAERFWTINQTGLTGFSYALTLDLSTLSGVQNFANLKLLKRNNASSPWLDVETLPGVTITRNAPFITVAGLTSFSDFTIGSDASNQLPVELTEFGFRKADSGIELHWRTATEQNNAGFEVQRRSENRGASTEWHALGFVRGNGTTTEAQSYSFLDRTAVGKVQYRLKQIDFDGQFEYSNIIEVDAGLPKVFALEQNYPNPFNPTTVISYQLPVASEVSLKVYDVLGREVMTLVNGRQEAGAYNFNFNASNLSSGVYFYRLQASATNGASSSNFVSTKKMMLVK